MLVHIHVIQYFVWVFFLYFSFPFDDIDIVGLISIIYLVFDHFIFQLAFVRFVIQFHTCSIWFVFNLFSDFFLLIFVVCWTHQDFGHHVQVCFFLFFLFTIIHKMKMLKTFAMYRHFESQEMSKLLLWFFLNVLHRNFFMCFILSPLIDLSTLARLFRFNLYVSFWKTCGFWVFGLPTAPLMCPHVFLLSLTGSTSQCSLKYLHFNYKKVRFYALCEQIHVPPSPSLEASHQWVDIVLWANGICTLPNIIIVHPTQIDLIFWTISSCGMATTMVA